jgi:hypothetical protein
MELDKSLSKEGIFEEKGGFIFRSDEPSLNGVEVHSI